jgi:hypothetical protein
MSSAPNLATRSGGVAEAYERRSLEADDRRCRHGSQRGERVDGIVVVGVEHDERIGGREGLCREHGVRGAQRSGLHGELERHARGCAAPGVVAAHAIMLGADHEAHVFEAGIGEGADQVVHERTSHRDHPLHAAIGGRCLLGVEGHAVVRLPHARAEAARQDHRFRRHASNATRGHSPAQRHAWRRDRRGARARSYSARAYRNSHRPGSSRA